MCLVAHQAAYMLGVTIGDFAWDCQVVILFLAQPAEAVGIDQAESCLRRTIRPTTMPGRTQVV